MFEKKIFRLLSLLIASVFCAGLTGCGTDAAAPASSLTARTAATEETASSVPKYIFLFIGDGMSYPQIQCTNYYLNARANGTSLGGNGAILQQENALSFLDFPVAGSAQTFDSTSYCPDSSSCATAIATGHKTYSSSLNMDEIGTVAYETIAEKLRQQNGYRIGLVTTVNLNHATPAAFYAHQPSRTNYYEIGLEMVDSGVDYLAGGALLTPTGANNDQPDLYELAQQAGYTVTRTQAESEAVTADTGKVLLVDEHPADSGSMAYEIDREEGAWSLTDYVDKGIEVLDNDTGFFMMVEGGKIDWACHGNDAATAVNDVKALSDAVSRAVEFYDEHPDETLILVTGDHETGGLTIGYAGTNYDTFLQNLAGQKLSFTRFTNDYVTAYRENNTPFSQVLADVQDLFGLTTEAASGQQGETGVTTDSVNSHPSGVTSGSLVMTDLELQQLQDAYNRTMEGIEEPTQEEYLLYGSYDPLTVTITHILDNKSGVHFSSYSHTGLPVAVFALGVGQQEFCGFYDNTHIYDALAALTGVA